MNDLITEVAEVLSMPKVKEVANEVATLVNGKITKQSGRGMLIYTIKNIKDQRVFKKLHNKNDSVEEIEIYSNNSFYPRLEMTIKFKSQTEYEISSVSDALKVFSDLS